MSKSHRLWLSPKEIESTSTFLKNLGVPNTTQMMKNILAGWLSVSWIGIKEKRYIISNVKTMKKGEKLECTREAEKRAEHRGCTKKTLLSTHPRTAGVGDVFEPENEVQHCSDDAAPTTESQEPLPAKKAKEKPLEPKWF